MNRSARIVSTLALAERLRATIATKHVPLVVLRLPELERCAWREGRPAARRLERTARGIFSRGASRTLRTCDALAHDLDTGTFCVALLAETRSAGTIALPADCRATFARMATAFATELEIEVEGGWTIVTTIDGDGLASAIETAIERGARERERYDFFSTVGHELRTPLTSIRGYLETVLEDDTLDAETARRYLTIARVEALRMGRLVDGMFDISLLDVRVPTFDHPESRPRATLAHAIGTALLAQCANAAQASVLTSSLISELPELAISIDSDRTTQVFVNVIGNAIRHGRRGGEVLVRLGSCDERFVEVYVDDDGPGIAENERDAVFELGYRSSAAVASGSGLGLAFVKRVVERAGGGVRACTSPLGGARIALRLPRYRSAVALGP